MGKESTCQCRAHGLIPGLGGFHMPWSNEARVPQLLSLCSRTREPQLPSATTQCNYPVQLPSATTQSNYPVQLPSPTTQCNYPATSEARGARSCAPQTREATTVRSPSLQLEKAHVQHRRPSTAKNKNNNQKKKPKSEGAIASF